MSTKLTLTLNKAVIERAKKYAQDNGESLSSIVENYFKYIISDRSYNSTLQLSPKVQALKGIVKVGEDFDYKSILSEELSKKYDR